MVSHNAIVTQKAKPPKKDPPWFTELPMPTRLRNRLKAIFTLHRDGYVCWYRGAPRFCCGRKVPPQEAEQAWEKKREDIDAALDKRRSRARADSLPLKVLLSLYIERQTRRVETGRPKPLSRFTLEDQIRTLRTFAKIVGPDRDVSELDAGDFNQYATRFDKRAASTMARNVAYVKAMFAWGDDAGHCKAPGFGPDFIKPPEAIRRDERIQRAKSYSPSEVQALWKVARREERLWIALGLNCAFDNSDISSLTWEVIDLDGGLIDFRRRKVGRVRRVVPLVPRTLRLLKAYRRLHPKAVDVFRTPTGQPLVRMNQKENGRASPVDFISARWTKLLQKSGIRQKAKTIRVEENGVRRRKLIWAGKGDGRGFRGLRTTFANHVKPGYGDERKIIMGHAHGTTFLDNYLESVGTERLKEVVIHVWEALFKDQRPPDAVSPPATSSASSSQPPIG